MAIVQFTPADDLRAAVRPRYRFFFQDNAGDPATAYADAGGTLAHAAPVVLNRFGEFPPMYVDDTVAFQVSVQNEFGVLVGLWELTL